MLYLVATPIGNLGDVSVRALEVLKAVDLIAAEDTRHTARLLQRYEITTRQMSFHEHNEERAVEKIVEVLRQGRSVALVSDAGTPGISDPGFVLVRACIDAGLELTMVPGASALVEALVLSGLPSHAFTFRGFPPRRPGRRRRFLEVDRASPHTLIFYESVHRIGDLLEDARLVYGDRRAALANDLTKKFESVQRGTLSELAARLKDAPARGEFVLVVEGAGEGAAADAERDADDPRDPDESRDRPTPPADDETDEP
jgi:16S rRNA (cytidine1402-2'-O)-methyltransferase